MMRDLILGHKKRLLNVLEISTKEDLKIDFAMYLKNQKSKIKRAKRDLKRDFL